MPMAPAFRSRLVAREPLYGAWSVISSPLSVRLLAAAGLDYVVIDLQHGEATEADLPGLTSAIRLAMAESAAAVSELYATLAVDGVDGLYVGPGDLSLSLGCAPDPDDPVLDRALQRVWAACAAAGKPVGVHATDGVTARRYREAGCTVITTAVDATAITRDAAAQLSLARA
jgi:2-keto-3-deoxy-L-rhamnonate aldolase RhmA